MAGPRKAKYLEGHYWVKIMHTITAHEVKVAEYSLNQTKKCYEYSSDFVGVYTALMTSQIHYFKGFQGHKKGPNLLSIVYKFLVNIGRSYLECNPKKSLLLIISWLWGLLKVLLGQLLTVTN